MFTDDESFCRGQVYRYHRHLAGAMYGQMTMFYRIAMFARIALFMFILGSNLGDQVLPVYSTPEGIAHEKRLQKELLINYDKMARPDGLVRNGIVEPLRVNITFTLKRILASDDRLEALSVLVYIQKDWLDPGLYWDPGEYGNVTHTTLNQASIWTPTSYLPHLTLMNPDDKRERFATVLIGMMNSDQQAPAATIHQITYALFEERCAFDMTFFPFDQQQCQMCMTNTQDEVERLVYEPFVSQDSEYFVPGGEWDLIDVVPTAIVFMTSTACFNVTVQRKADYYLFNLFLPTLSICLLNTIGLFARIDTDHNELDFSNLGQTTLLSLGVVLLTVADQMPKGANAISLLGIFFLCMIFQTLLAALNAVYLKKYYRHRMNRVAPVGAPSRAMYKQKATQQPASSFLVRYGPGICLTLHLIVIIAITGVVLGIGYANDRLKE